MPLWTPSQIATDLWLDCADVSTIYSSNTGGSLVADGGAVGRIEDKSGNGRHATEANASLRPVRSGPTVVFTADRLSIPTSAFSLGKMIIGVFNSIGFGTDISAGFININSSPSDNPEIRFGTNSSGTPGSWYQVYWNGVYVVNDTYNATTSSVFALALTSGITFTAWRNGTQQVTATRSGTWSTLNEFTLGYYNRISGSRDGTLRELIICDPSNREIVEGYLAWKWGFVSSLPSGHLYKNAPPGDSPVGIGGEVGWWCPSLDDTGSGSALLRDFVGGSPGALTNMNSATAWVPDIEKGGTRALELDGVDDQIVTTAPGITTTDRSTSLWFRTNRSYSSGQYGMLLRWGTAASYPADIGKDWVVIIGTDANLGTNGIGISQYGDAVGATGFNDGKWHHLYVEAKGSVYSVYVDGVFRASKTMTTNATAGTITIGNSLGVFYRDYIDDIRVFNRALSPIEIATLAARRMAAKYLWTAERVTTKAWYDSADRLTIFNSNSGGSLPADNQAVGRWQDKSGNARHLVQASSGNRPLRRTAVQNGLDAIRFDDTDDRLQDAGAASYWTFLHYSTSSVFYVAKINVANPDSLGFTKNLCSFLGTYETTWTNRGWVSFLDDRSSLGANNRISAGAGPGNGIGSSVSISINNGFPTLQANLVALFGDIQNATIANRMSLKVNGSTAVPATGGSQPASSSDPLHSLRVGAVWDGSWAMNGDMYEIIIIEGIVSDLVRDQVEGYLAWKWGIQSQLPSDHPYKSAAPTVQLGGRRRRNIGSYGL